MERETIRMKDLLKSGAKKIVLCDVAEDDFVDVECEEPKKNVIPVKFVDVEKVQIPEIKDVKGRLSDIVQSIEMLLDISVVPFEMANIAPEVVRLQRHEIFHLDGKLYAMSKEPREEIVQRYTEKVIESFRNGLPFIENLSVVVTYQGKDYKTLALSCVEWTILMSKFRSYKQSLEDRENSNLVLSIYPEHSMT